MRFAWHSNTMYIEDKKCDLFRSSRIHNTMGLVKAHLFR